ncbi:hypothetical protein [Micromonospora thermarum]|uniref:hypothetical protein n=1 Tax=Micromonospora thermarum TaxID=2720024 RepID=UPI0035A18730
MAAIVEEGQLRLCYRRDRFHRETVISTDAAAALIDAAEYFHGRLPEAFAGYPRTRTTYPVEYPTACSPQAWSTGTPLLLLRVLLGLEPQGEHLIVDPELPTGIGRIELLNIPGRWGRMDAFGRSRTPEEEELDRTRFRARPQAL